ncbi:lipopolysaccharide transport periplasmic protein LptA [Paracoccus sp. (in: a-proteobacteria)]|uniref:lipopolysaccharide transport periplasmic protein LptA n=1 Tax=Paracoccus sp. TaxID=267 RepID=UPI003A846D23
MLRQILIVLLLFSAPAMAQNVSFGMKADTSLPIDTESDSLSVNQSDGTALFTGNVVIGQGEMRLKADTVTVEYVQGTQNRIESLHAKGNVTLVSGPDAAEAREADYQVGTGFVTLIGDVVMTHGDNVLTGETVHVDLNTGTARAEGRVRSILQPDNQ